MISKSLMSAGRTRPTSPDTNHLNTRYEKPNCKQPGEQSYELVRCHSVLNLLAMRP